MLNSKFFKKLNPIIRIILGLLFILSSVSKLYVFNDFVFYINEFLLWNSFWSLIIASIVIAVELSIGILLLFEFYLKYSLMLSMIILLFFSIFLIYLWFYLPDTECFCFGKLNIFNNLGLAITKNVILILLTGFMLVRNKYESVYFKPALVSIGFFIFFYGLNIYSIGYEPVNIEYLEVSQIGEDRFIMDNILMIDARPKAIYKQERIYNSISIPYYEIGFRIGIYLDQIDGSKLIVTYCDSQACTLSKKLATTISKNLNRKVYILKGGIGAWKESGMLLQRDLN